MAEIVAEFGQYLEFPGEMLQTAVEEVAGFVEKARKLASDLQPAIVEFCSDFRDNLQRKLTDLAPIPSGMKKTLLDSYAGVAFHLIFGSLGLFAGATILPFVLGLLFDNSCATLTALVLLPVVAYGATVKMEMARRQRIKLIAVSTLLSSMLLGHLLHDRCGVLDLPPTFLFPLCMAVAVTYAPSGLQRHLPFAAAMGAAALASILLGAVFGSSGKNFMFACGMSIVAFVDFQLKMAGFFDGVGVCSWQVVSVTLHQGAGLILAFFLSSFNAPE